MSVPLLLSAPDVVGVAVGYQIGTGRTVPGVAAVVALAGVVLAGLALARPRTGRWPAFAALATGLVGAVVGGVHAANAAGGPGTGNGLVGAVVAVVLGLTGLVLGGLALARTHRAAAPGAGAGR